MWNEHLNVLCEAGADLLTLDVYEFISVGREAIIGSASVELKHLLLGGFSDEWNEYSLRVDKETGAIVNFRCCFKPFVGQQRYVVVTSVDQLSPLLVTNRGTCLALSYQTR